MKIVCENCSTKYSIADDKVRGKVFKIRCKKCGHIIVVKGTSVAPAAAAPAPAAGQFDDKETRVFDYSGFADSMSSQAVWHLVIDGGQVGPLSPDQVKAKYDAGEIDGDTYTWREGFKDWLRLFDVEDFASLAGDGEAPTEVVSQEQAQAMFSSANAKAAATPAPRAATPAPRAATPAPAAAKPTPAPAGGMFGGAAQEPAAQEKPKSDLFGGLPPEPEPAAEPAPSGGDLFPSAGSGGADGGGGLFASPAASGSPASSKGSLFPDEPEEESGSPQMTGQRNENSVLFSLSNLQSLASGGGAPKPAAAAAAAAGPAKPGYASAKGGGSGLVDIRAMAAATAASGKQDAASDGFSFASPSLAAPISAAPVLMPVADSGRPAWLLPAIIGGIVLLLAVVVLLVIVLTKKPTPAPTSHTASTAMDGMGGGSDTMGAAAMDAMDNMGADAMTAMGADAMTAMGADAMDAMTAMGADAMTAMDAMGSDAMSTAGKRRRRRRGSFSGRAMSAGSRRTMSAGSTSRSMARARSTMARSMGSSSLQDLLRRAGGSMKSMGASSAASNLPQRLSMGKIRKGVYRIVGSARACFNRYRVPGRCRVRVVIKGSSGRVSSASILGSFKGTPTGRCVARAFKRARFSKFKSASQSFVFPLIFR